jgi:hypothetical protein
MRITDSVALMVLLQPVAAADASTIQAAVSQRIWVS